MFFWVGADDESVIPKPQDKLIAVWTHCILGLRQTPPRKIIVLLRSIFIARPGGQSKSVYNFQYVTFPKR